MAVVPIRGLTRLREIDKAAALAMAAIGRVPGAAIVLPNDALLKLRWLERGGRDFREVTNVMKAEVNDAFVDALRKVAAGKAPVSAPWKAAAEAYRDRLATRLATSGGDVRNRLRKLKPSTIRRKGHSRIGVDSGLLLKQVSTAATRVTRENA